MYRLRRHATWGVRLALILLSMSLLSFGVLPPGQSAAQLELLTSSPTWEVFDRTGGTADQLLEGMTRLASIDPYEQAASFELQTALDGELLLAETSGRAASGAGARVIMTPTPGQQTALAGGAAAPAQNAPGCTPSVSATTEALTMAGTEPTSVRVTVSATGSGNALQRLTWTGVTNAQVRLGSNPNASPIPIPAFADFNPTVGTFAFTVTKVTMGQPFSVNFVARDGCGDAQKFAGAGTYLPPTATPGPTNTPPPTATATPCVPSVQVVTNPTQWNPANSAEPTEIDVVLQASGYANNQLQRITWTGVSNANVMLNSAPIPVPAYADFVPTTPTWSFKVQKVNLGQGFTVSFVARDMCGEITKFAGAGLSVPPTATPLPTSTATLTSTVGPTSTTGPSLTPSITLTPSTTPTLGPSSTPGTGGSPVPTPTATLDPCAPLVTVTPLPSGATPTPPPAGSGERVYVTSFTQHLVSVVNPSNANSVTTITLGDALNPKAPKGIAVRPGGAEVFVANTADHTVSVIDTASSSVVATISVSTSLPVGVDAGIQPNDVVFNPAGTRAYVANFQTGNVSVIDTVNRSVIASVAVGSGPSGMAVNSAGTRLYVSNLNGDSLSVVNITNNTLDSTYDTASGVGAIESPDGVLFTDAGAGSRVFVANRVSFGNGKVLVLDASSAPSPSSLISAICVGNDPRRLALNPSANRLYVANESGASVNVIDTVSNSVMATIPVVGNPYGVALSQDGLRLYVTSQLSTGKILVFNAMSFAPVGEAQVGENPQGIAYKP